MKNIDLQMSLDDCMLITGALSFLYKISQDNKFEVVLKRVNYWIKESLKKQELGE